MEHENLKNNTELMYNNTIEEMRARGEDEEKIAVVEEAKRSAMAAYDEELYEDEEPYATKEDISDSLRNMASNSTPLMANLFIVHIGDVPIYQIRSFYFSPKEKEFSIGFYETKEFASIKYFIENKKFDNVSVEFLSPLGETLRIDRFDSVSVKLIMPDGLSYETDRPIGSYIKFKYKKYVPSAN